MPAPFHTHVSRPHSQVEGGDASMNRVETDPHLGALTQHVAGRLAVPGAFGAAEAKVLMDSGSCITAISQELVEALQG